METNQKFKPESENIKNEPYSMGHTEPCAEFIGHPDDPCDRCGFTYYRH